jgi:hypothetical protein
MDEPRTVEAKLAFDEAAAALSAQRETLNSLQSKAKDLIGLLTLSATFLGAFTGGAGDAVESIWSRLNNGPEWLMVLFVGLPGVTVACALLVMLPRGLWIFNIDAGTIRTSMDSRKDDPSVAFANLEELYLGYTQVLIGFERHNAPALARRKYLVWASMVGLGLTIGLVGYLVLNPATS